MAEYAIPALILFGGFVAIVTILYLAFVKNGKPKK